ncbi:unnamed protein product [Gongylonema pulchrum]|uniref:ANK_REP_REGION domain-containing protein n=1 Tax=Gongylonema pulchrum TaxID=637853 RepID=A0A183DSA6_9BILA|nr:unnamed protein product [Gongylonema pulchrum]
MTPDEWNKFGNIESRELGRLYIPDRIPTETEKLLCNFSPDLGRVTRNKLKTVLKTETSPPKTPTARPDGAGPAKGKKGRGGKDDAAENDSRAIPMAAVPSGADVPDELLFSMSPTDALQIALADTSTEGEENFPAPSHQSPKTRGSSSSRKRGGRGRGRGRPRKSCTPVAYHPELLQDNESDAVSSFQSGEQSFIVSSSTEGRSASANVFEQSSCSLDTSEAAPLVIDEQETEDFSPGAPRFPARGRARSPTEEAAAAAAEAAAEEQRRRATTPRRTILTDQFRAAALSNRLSTVKWTGRCIPERRGFDINQKFRGKTLAIEKSTDSIDTAQSSEPNVPSKSAPVRSALEMLALEMPELPLPITVDPITAIEIATLRRHQQNREKPLTTYEQFRAAALSNRLSTVKWTGRCIPERRGFDINQKFRGKTLAIELCERPCGPHHEIDDMLQQIVQDGARLDLPDDTKGRIPLHFAVEGEFWCRVKVLLHLRDITVRRVLCPVVVRAMWEFEFSNWTTEFGFNYETSRLPNDRYGYMILLAAFDYRSSRYWRVRMWGESQFADVQVNDRPVQSLSYDSHGYIYVSNLINGWNRVKIRFHPFVKKRKLLLMAQVHRI